MKKLMKLSMVLLLSVSVLVGCSNSGNVKQEEKKNEPETVGIWKEGEFKLDGKKIKMPLVDSSSLIKLGCTSEDYETMLTTRTYTEILVSNNNTGLVIEAEISNLSNDEPKLMKNSYVTNLYFKKANMGSSTITFPGELTWDASLDKVLKVLGEAKDVSEAKDRIIYDNGVRMEFTFDAEGKMDTFFISA